MKRGRGNRAVFFAFFVLFQAPVLRADLMDAAEEPTAFKTDSRTDGRTSTPATQPNKVNDSPSSVKTNPSQPNSAAPHASKNATTMKARPESKDEVKPPITFNGETFIGNSETGEGEVDKNVVVKQGDLTLTSDHAKIFMDPVTREAKRVVATGNVRLIKIDSVTGEVLKSRSAKAEFDAISRVVTLSGDAIFVKNSDEMRGQTIDYDMKTGWIKAVKVRGVMAP